MIKLSRRDLLMCSGAAVGGFTLGGALSACGNSDAAAQPDPTQQNSLFDALPIFPLGEPIAADQMRITFLGTSCIPRLSQECNSIFVEVGSGDRFVFDCGTGIIAKYNAMGIPMSKMDKIFLTHLHGDHMSDLTHIYCFGPAEDRKSPLYVWGPNDSGFTYTDPDKATVRGPYADGTRAFCENFRKVMRWHTESFSFGSTSYAGYTPPTRADWGLPVDPIPVGDDSPNDAYALIPIEVDWTKKGLVINDNVAYYNPITKVKITHFPAIHCRRGSISYKLEWNGLSMIFSGDTKPSYDMIDQAKGVDVFIHEMVVPADVWAAKNLGYSSVAQAQNDPLWDVAYNYALAVQNSSHTPQGAFGYMLSQIRPRLAVATHFQAADDTIASAMQSVRNLYPIGDITFAVDFMVINVSKTQIIQRKAVVSNLAFYPKGQPHNDLNTPKYWAYNKSVPPKKVPDPYAQIDMTRAVPATDPNTKVVNYRDDGY